MFLSPGAEGFEDCLWSGNARGPTGMAKSRQPGGGPPACAVTKAALQEEVELDFQHGLGRITDP